MELALNSCDRYCKSSYIVMLYDVSQESLVADPDLDLLIVVFNAPRGRSYLCFGALGTLQR